MSDKKKQDQHTLGFMIQGGLGAAGSKSASQRRTAPKPALNSDISYDLPMPTSEMVQRINALAPDDSEFEVLQG